MGGTTQLNAASTGAYFTGQTKADTSFGFYEGGGDVGTRLLHAIQLAGDSITSVDGVRLNRHVNSFILKCSAQSYAHER